MKKYIIAAVVVSLCAISVIVIARVVIGPYLAPPSGYVTTRSPEYSPEYYQQDLEIRRQAELRYQQSLEQAERERQAELVSE